MATTAKPAIFTEDGELPKAYDPKAVEGPVYAWWEESGYFAPPPERPDEPEPVRHHHAAAQRDRRAAHRPRDAPSRTS